MAKMTLEELRKLRESKKAEMNRRDPEGKDIDVIIGMGTCGLAAGAKATFEAFVEELNKHGVANTRIRQTGCMGLCYFEPTVEVKVPGMPDTIYGNVDAETARKIVQKHILGKVMINDHIIDRPAADIIAE